MAAPTPEELPWTTAPEHVDVMLEQLGIDPGSETARRAREYALEYDIGPSMLDRSPKSVAAASLYFAQFFESSKKFTQDEIRDATGVSPLTLRVTYHEIAEAEGYLIGTGSADDRDADRDDEPGLFARIVEWFA